MENSQEKLIELFNKKLKELLEEGEKKFNQKINEFNNTHFESKIDELESLYKIHHDFINILWECNLVDIRKAKTKAKTYWNSL